MFGWFEQRLNPFPSEEPGLPPKGLVAFCWHYTKPAWPWLLLLGFCSMLWHSSPEEYGGVLGLDQTALGIPTQREFLDRYFAHAAPTGPLLRFHLVFGLFRFAVIFVGIADRAQAGSAAGADATSVAPLATRFAVRAMEVIEGARPW